MTRAKPQFPPAREMRILSVVQIMILNPENNSHSVLKVDVKHLNQKLQKLQKENRKIVAISFTDLDKEPHFHPGGQDVREH